MAQVVEKDLGFLHNFSTMAADGLVTPRVSASVDMFWSGYQWA